MEGSNELHVPTALAVYEKTLQDAEAQAAVLRGVVFIAAAAMAILPNDLALQSPTQQMIVDAQRDLDVLDSTIKTIRARMQEVRDFHPLDPHVMASFPVELLRAIFFAFASILDAGIMRHDRPTFKRHDARRAALPFTLAAICHRWRQVALDSPSFWGSYLALGSVKTLDDCQRAQRYVDIILSRSRSSCLDISIDWHDVEQATWDELGEHLIRILDALGSHAQRWRSFSLYLPNRPMPSETFNLFLQPTPALEQLDVFYLRKVTFEPSSDADLPAYLPHSPKLRRLGTDRCHVVWSEPHPPVPSMTDLSLVMVSLPPSSIWAMLSLCPALVSLRLGLDARPQSPSSWHPTSQLCLPALKSLSLLPHADTLLAAWAASLDLPALTTLALYGSRREDLLAIFAHIGRNVAVLLFSPAYSTECVDGEDVACLSALRSLTVMHILLLSCSGISAEFFQLCAADRVWPCLRAMLFSHGEIGAAAADALVDLVRTRNVVPAGESSDERSLRRVESVTFRCTTIPDNLKDRLSVLMNPEAPHTEVF